MTGYTLVTRESEWGDGERDKMLALAEYEAGICECGMHQSIADTDPDLDMLARICPVCSGLAKNFRIIADSDEKAMKELHGNKVPPPEAERPEDGRHYSLRIKPPQA